jgi:V-type H+-transporting ATPase subunit C
MVSADNVLKTKMNSYTQTKSALQALQRKETWVTTSASIHSLFIFRDEVLNHAFLAAETFP